MQQTGMTGVLFYSSGMPFELKLKCSRTTKDGTVKREHLFDDVVANPFMVDTVKLPDKGTVASLQPDNLNTIQGSRFTFEYDDALPEGTHGSCHVRDQRLKNGKRRIDDLCRDAYVESKSFDSLISHAKDYGLELPFHVESTPKSTRVTLLYA